MTTNPIAGFRLLRMGGKTYLKCRGSLGRGHPSWAGCNFSKMLRQQLYLEDLIQLAYDHRRECGFAIPVSSSRRLPLRITDWSLYDSVNNLLKYWTAQGPPPLGSSISRWWDKRLVMLRWTLEGKHIPEGDPRYNLVQDLIEGDGTTQDRAAKELGL